MNASIYREGVNPGLSLYNFWMTTLGSTIGEVGGSTDAIHFGRSRNHGIGGDHRNLTSEDAVLTFGSVWGGSIYPYFALRPNGDFQIRGLWGFTQRQILARHTFLSYGWIASRYRWAIDTEDTSFHTHPNKPDVTYTSERLLKPQGYGTQYLNWWRPALVEGEWQIQPAPDNTFAGEWVTDNEQRARRYRRARTAYQVAMGITPEVSALTARVSLDGQRIEPDEAVRQIVALLDVSTPAKTTALQPRGSKEAQNGDHVVTAHQ